ncbi:MAG TPA: 2-phospho-L-lactate guanylyltransferase [Candidatus Limnocylindrales bacterium]|nr:2-phospho-L-lactate guanylyltransferase [Candidatus Limnocylindrales bacterium]
MPTPLPQERIVAVVPVRGLEGAKSRLGGVLDAEERRDLVSTLLRRVVEAAAATPGVTEVVVVSPDPEALELAASTGARPLRQSGMGLNEGLEAARVDVLADGPAALLVLPADLPTIEPGSIEAILKRGVPSPAVVLVPDRHGRGTNALLLAPAGIIDFAFGGDSRAEHATRARAAGARYEEVDAGLGLDLDTSDDLLILEADRASGLSIAAHPEAAPERDTGTRGR